MKVDFSLHSSFSLVAPPSLRARTDYRLILDRRRTGRRFESGAPLSGASNAGHIRNLPRCTPLLLFCSLFRSHTCQSNRHYRRAARGDPRLNAEMNARLAGGKASSDSSRPKRRHVIIRITLFRPQSDRSHCFHSARKPGRRR